MKALYVDQASRVIKDPNVLVNVVSKRVKQLRSGAKSGVESFERLSPEDVTLREIAEGKLIYDLKE